MEIWYRILYELAQHLKDVAKSTLMNVFLRYFFKRQKREDHIGKLRRSKGSRITVITDNTGLPITVWTAKANRHEVKLFHDMIDMYIAMESPKRLIADRAYDSDPLRRELEQRGIELICPHRIN